MTLPGGVQRQCADTGQRTSKPLPPAWLEYSYYAQVFYSIMSGAIGLSFGRLGILMLAALGGLCVLHMGKYVAVLMRPALAPLACGLSYVAVQMIVHQRSLDTDYVREFIPWLVSLVIVQYLALRRGFLHRSAIVIFLIGLSTLPYLKSFANDASRVGAENITIGNPNDLAAWFGFICVYFTVLALESRRDWVRAMSSVIALGCLLVIGLTVSRGPLFAAACSIVLALRRVLKRGFVPFLTLIVLAWIAYGLGLFERSTAMYAQRGLEETGRLIVWPLAINRFLESPLAGVGVNRVNTLLPDGGMVSPHNGFIFIGLASGVVPLLFLIVYWILLFAETFKVGVRSHEDASFHTPLLAYSFLILMNLNEAFMAPWMMATLAAVTSAGFLVKAKRVVAARWNARDAFTHGGSTLVGRGRA